MKQIQLESAIGKVVAAVECNDYTGAVIVFNDDTYTVLQAVQEYDTAYLRNDLISEKDLRWSFSDAVAIRLGIITVEQIQAEIEQKERNRRMETERMERKELERLKAKYGA